MHGWAGGLLCTWAAGRAARTPIITTKNASGAAMRAILTNIPRDLRLRAVRWIIGQCAADGNGLLGRRPKSPAGMLARDRQCGGHRGSVSGPLAPCPERNDCETEQDFP